MLTLVLDESTVFRRSNTLMSVSERAAVVVAVVVVVLVVVVLVVVLAAAMAWTMPSSCGPLTSRKSSYMVWRLSSIDCQPSRAGWQPRTASFLMKWSPFDSPTHSIVFFK